MGIIRVYVSMSEAIRAGKVECGWRALSVSDEQVAALAPPLREALAQAVCGDPPTLSKLKATGRGLACGLEHLELSGSTWKDAVAYLEKMVAEEGVAAERVSQAAIAEAEQADKRLEDCVQRLLAGGPAEVLWQRRNDSPWCLDYDDTVQAALKDPRLAGLADRALALAAERNEAQRAVSKAVEEKRAELERQEKEKAEQYRLALAAWVAIHGSAEIKEQLELGCLDEEAVLAEVRDVLFGALELTKYSKIRPRDVHCRCPRWEQEDQGSGVVFRTDTAVLVPGQIVSSDWDEPTLTVEEARRLSEIVAMLPPEFKAEAQIHRGWCQRCFDSERDDGEVRAASVLITVDFHGRPLSREFSLPALP